MGEMLTLTVPEAGKLLGLGRDGAYQAVARGELPVLRFGRRMVVSRKALERLIDDGHQNGRGHAA